MTDTAVQKTADFSTVSVSTKSMALVLARFLLANEFMLYGTRKFLNPPIIYQWIENFNLPGNLVYLVIPWQIFFGWMTFLAIQSRLASAALFGFCIIAPSLFWRASLENFTRDFAAAGGFVLLFSFGPGALSFDTIVDKNRHDVFARIFPFVMRWMGNPIFVGRLLLFGRALIALPFLADAVKKIIYLPQQMAFFETGHLPGGTVYLVIAAEAIFGLGLLVGYRARLCAAVLFIWALVLGFVLHNPDLGLFSGNFNTFVYNLFERNAGNLMSFEKDIGSLGALLMVMICGPGPVSLDAMTGVARSPAPPRS